MSTVQPTILDIPHVIRNTFLILVQDLLRSIWLINWSSQVERVKNVGELALDGDHAFSRYFAMPHEK